MHKNFYASGFLYHSPSQQILLQNKQITNTSSQWSLFEGLYLEKETPEVIFKNIIFKLLDIKINVVHHVHSYLNETKEKNHYIGYSKVRSRQNFTSKNGLTFAWFSFRDVLKLQATDQVKHDIVIGQRVIDAASRKRRGEYTLQ